MITIYKKSSLKKFIHFFLISGVVLSSFFYGYIITQIPGGYLAAYLGGKALYGGGIFMTALFTLITPVAARTSFYLLIAVRVLEGFFEVNYFLSNVIACVKLDLLFHGLMNILRFHVHLEVY